MALLSLFEKSIISTFSLDKRYLYVQCIWKYNLPESHALLTKIWLIFFFRVLASFLPSSLQSMSTCFTKKGRLDQLTKLEDKLTFRWNIPSISILLIKDNYSNQEARFSRPLSLDCALKVISLIGPDCPEKAFYVDSMAITHAALVKYWSAVSFAVGPFCSDVDCLPFTADSRKFRLGCKLVNVFLVRPTGKFPGQTEILKR